MKINYPIILPAAFMVLCGFSGTVHAQDFLPQPDVVQTVIDTHPLVEKAGSTVRSAEAEAEQLRVGDQEFVASGGYANRDVKQQGHFNEWEMGVSRPIRLPGKAELDVQTGGLGVEAQQASRDWSRHQVAVMLLESWVGWLEAEALAAIDRQEEGNWTAEHAAMVRRVAARDASQLDLEQIATVLARAKGNSALSKGKARETLATLQRQFPDLAIPAHPPTIAIPEMPARPFADWFQPIQSHNDALRFAELEAKKLDAVAKRKAQDQWADPTVGVRYFSERGGDENGVGLTFSIPIGGGYRNATTDMARADASASWSNLAVARRQASDNADQLIVRAESNYNRWQQEALALESSQSVQKKSARAFELGQLSLSDYLLVSRQHYETVRAELQARAATQMYFARLRIDAKELWLQ